MKDYLTPIKAIRKNCLDCCNHQPSAVKECDMTDCPLWAYRLGTNLRRRGINQRKIVNAEIVS